jgi:hypothetical protein
MLLLLNESAEHPPLHFQKKRLSLYMELWFVVIILLTMDTKVEDKHP